MNQEIIKTLDAIKQELKKDIQTVNENINQKWEKHIQDMSEIKENIEKQEKQIEAIEREIRKQNILINDYLNSEAAKETWDLEWGGDDSGGDSDGDDGSGKQSASGYTTPMNLSPELAALMGQNIMAPHKVVKRVWTIIKERDLYDPKQRQFAICDDALFKVIGVKRFRTFGMYDKYLKGHFIS